MSARPTYSAEHIVAVFIAVLLSHFADGASSAWLHALIFALGWLCADLVWWLSALAIWRYRQRRAFRVTITCSGADEAVAELQRLAERAASIRPRP